MRIIKFNESVQYNDLLEKIKVRFFDDYPFITINSKLEGYRVYPDRIEIGSRVAFVESSIQAISDALFHEMSHIVIIKNNKRLLVSNYGLTYKKVEVFGRLYDEPLKYDGVVNEVKAIVWQKVLCDEFDIKFDPFDFSKSLVYLTDFINVPLKNAYCYMGDDVDKKYKWYHDENYVNLVSYSDMDNMRLEFIYDMVKEFLIDTEKYNINTFEKLWSEKMTFIKNNI